MQLDSSGLIVTLKNNGGDSCAEEGRYWFLFWFNFVYLSNFDIALKVPQRPHPFILIKKLEITPGIYVRNPTPPSGSEWQKDPKTTSRDQLKPIIWYCAAYRDHKRLFRLFKKVLSRGLFAQNSSKDGKRKLPDQMFTTLGSFIRAGGYWTAPLYPLLLIFDTIDLLSILLWLAVPLTANDNLTWYKPSTWFTKRTLDDVDDNNTDVDLLASIAFKPTPIAALSRFFWGQYRPINFGVTVLHETNNCQGAMAWYHSVQNGGNVEVSELYKTPIEKYLKKQF